MSLIKCIKRPTMMSHDGLNHNGSNDKLGTKRQMHWCNHESKTYEPWNHQINGCLNKTLDHMNSQTSERSSPQWIRVSNRYKVTSQATRHISTKLPWLGFHETRPLIKASESSTMFHKQVPMFELPRRMQWWGLLESISWRSSKSGFRTQYDKMNSQIIF